MSDPLEGEWKRLVKQSQEAAAAPPPPPPPPPPRPGRRGRWGLPALFILSLVLLALWFQGALNPWPEKPTPEELEAGQRASLMMALRAIHDYAAFHGRYPRSIDEVLPLAIKIHYERTADGFELRVDGPNGEPIIVRGK